MKKLLYIFVLFVLFSSCNEYHKALKSVDSAEKYRVGTKMFDDGKYNKANRLFVQIVPKYRGRPQAQRLMYMYSKTFYEMRDYYTANYQFERFVSAYPESEKVEEAAYLAAKSYYHLSPRYSKEQKETVEAIEKLQAFINMYPESEYTPEANELVRELDFKLEQKAYEIAYNYNKTAFTSQGDFDSAIYAFDKFLLDFPGSSFREDAMFYRFDSAYKLAVNSVTWKMEERLNNAIGQYDALKRTYPETKYAEQADKMLDELNVLLQSFTAPQNNENTENTKS